MNASPLSALQLLLQLGERLPLALALRHAPLQQQRGRRPLVVVLILLLHGQGQRGGTQGQFNMVVALTLIVNCPKIS